MPRKPPRPEPLLGLAVGGSTWVLATEDFVKGGNIPWCADPLNSGGDPKKNRPWHNIKIAKIEGVRPVKDIRYWGHYPVADMEFETNAPVSVALRAWAPLVPGDVPVSNIPAGIFEVHLRNTSGKPQQGTIAFNFPGPDTQEAMGTEFARKNIKETFEGVLVRSTGDVSYVLGVIGDEHVRLGAGLHSHPNAWSNISAELPKSSVQDSSASAAVDFSLDAGEKKTVRFILTWYAPVMQGASKGQAVMVKENWLRAPERGDTNYYTHMYAARYEDALDVARRITAEHGRLLKRVIAWQEVIYSENNYPVWLRDVLVNSLCLIAENSYWVQAKHPLGDWAYPQGMFGMNDSPRGCPHTNTIPDIWVGTLPVTYLFPEMMQSMLKGYKQYQRDDGEIPFSTGQMWNLPDFATPEYFWQVSLNGTCYVSLVDRLWQSTGDDRVLREFYESVKRCNTFAMNLASGPAGVISIADRGGSEWFEHSKWHGMVAHIGGLHLAQLRILERMAIKMGDAEYAEKCRRWFAGGSKALEGELWAGSYYLNYYDKKTGKKSDDVLAMQLDGHFLARHHGVEGVFRPDRLATTLETIKRCNMAMAPKAGVLTFARPDGSLIDPEKDTSIDTGYNPNNVFPGNGLIVAATYVYSDKADVGMQLAARIYENLVLRQRHPWDMPNILNGSTGRRVHGTDYTQMMVAWDLPAALERKDLSTLCQSGGLVDRMLKAAK